MKRRQYRKVYLYSAWWREFRVRAISKAGSICQTCGKHPKRLDVHHLTYARIGRERLTDVVVLCRSCHRKRHRK